MGTRHLIAVQIDGDYKIAQYGQWDGYPNGQGLDVLRFLRGTFADPDKEEKFTRGVRSCRWIDEDTYKNRWVECGADPDSYLVSMDVSAEFKSRFPELSRDTGAKILALVGDTHGLLLRNSIDFALDGLFCEWAYVIDLDARTLEVFKGFFNADPPAGQRFGKVPRMTRERDGASVPPEYGAVHMVHAWALDALPADEDFRTAFEGEE